MHFLRQFRLIAALLAAFFVLSLTACGSGSNSFTWFVDSIPANLDPQVASSAADVIACENLYSGLVRRTPDGQLAPELCERWEVSADQRTYTFYLKDGLTYTAAKGSATDYAITAEDFAFAFRRMFLPGTNSPYAVEFSALENSAAVLAGQMPASALGVSAPEPLQLVFHLSTPDETFLSKLTLPGAMPCDEEFFNSTRGTYGLTSTSTLSSGSFYLYNWTSGGLFLRRAASGEQIDSLRYIRPEIRVAGVLVNQWHRSPVVEDAAAYLREDGRVPVYDTVIRRTDKVPESSWARMAVQQWSPWCSAARDYRAWAAELLTKEGLDHE